MSQITIHIVIDNERFAVRHWPALPRVGEVVLLQDPQRMRDTLYPADVEAVIWGMNDAGIPRGELEVELVCKWRPV